MSLRVYTTRNRLLYRQIGEDVGYIWQPVDELLKDKWSRVLRIEKKHGRKGTEQALFWLSAYADLACEWTSEEWDCHDISVMFLLLSERVLNLNQFCLSMVQSEKVDIDKMPLTAVW